MDHPERATLYRQAQRAAVVGLVVNLALAGGKLAAGILGNAFALVADAVNSLGDAVASLVVVTALVVARRPPDPTHPYGHSRAEAVAGSNVALLIVLSAVGIAWEAIDRIPEVHGPPAAWTLAVAGANVLLKEGLYRYKLGVGRRTGSRALIANAWDHRSDALASLAVLVGLSVVAAGGPLWADEAAALVVAAMIVWAGVELFRASASELLDRQAPPELRERVRREVMAVEGVRELETLRLRKSGLEYFADLHVEVDSSMSVAEGHALGHRVKDRLLERFPTVRDVLVHLEPHPHSAAEDRGSAPPLRQPPSGSTP